MLLENKMNLAIEKTHANIEKALDLIYPAKAYATAFILSPRGILFRIVALPYDLLEGLFPLIFLCLRVKLLMIKSTV